MCYHKDARVRSAADSSLLQLLSNRNDVEDSICCLLDSIKQIPVSNHIQNIPTQSPADIGTNSIPPVIQSPAQINCIPQQENISKMDETADRIMRLIPKWAEKLPIHIWPDLIKRLIEKCFNSPEDGIIIKFLSSISLYLGNSSSLVLSLIIHRMKTQPL